MSRGSGCLRASGALRARGQGSTCGAAWEWAGPTAGMSSRFLGELNYGWPCGVSLSGLPADPCLAFHRFPAVPHGRSMPRLWRFPALRSGEGGEGMAHGGGGPRNPAGSGCLGESGVSRARGHGSADGAAGEPAGARGKGWVRVFAGNSTRLRLPVFLSRASPQIPAALCSASLLYLTAQPDHAFGAALRCGLG